MINYKSINDSSIDYSDQLTVEKLEKTRKALERTKKIFLYSGLMAPPMYSFYIFALYKFGDFGDLFNLVLFVFIGAFIFNVLGCMFMYYRYKKLLSLSDEKLINNAVYKNISKSYYDIIYNYYNIIVIIKCTSDTVTLIIDGEMLDSYKGNFQKTFRLSGKIGNNVVVVKYRAKLSKDKYSVYFNDRLIEDKFKEVINY